jgi:hypothetical protein
MLRTWPVRLPAMRFTLSVKVGPVPPTPAPAPGRRAFLRSPLSRHAGHSEAKPLS